MTTGVVVRRCGRSPGPIFVVDRHSSTDRFTQAVLRHLTP